MGALRRYVAVGSAVLDRVTGRSALMPSAVTAREAARQCNAGLAGSFVWSDGRDA